MKWYTCTPVDFGGGRDFFARDSGLMCRGFQEIGIVSKAVMPGARRAEDEEDLIRTTYDRLESPDWWREQCLDGVVLYAWGRPKYRNVAKAIREAGVFLMLNQDSGGLVSPLISMREWLTEQAVVSGRGRVSGGWWRFFKLVGRGLTLGLGVSDPLRASHLRQGNVIGCVSPAAAEHYRKFCRIYGGASLESRVHVIPHPVNPLFFLGGASKSQKVVAVGRWDDLVQKRPKLMMEVIARLIRENPNVSVEIIGSITEELACWHVRMSDIERERIVLRGRITPDEIATSLRTAQVSYCPSAFESFHIATGEALCSGCSVVSGRSSSLAAFEWFCSEGSGTLAETDDVDGHLKAIHFELSLWIAGGRDAEVISAHWRSRLQACEVARRVISLAGDQRT